MKPRRPSKLRYRQQYEAFCKRLALARSKASLTQCEVADRLGRPQSYVANCESGERRVDVVELAEFARVYRKPITFFIGIGTR